MPSKKVLAGILGIVIGISIFIPISVTLSENIRPMLLYPRFGNPVRTSPTSGSISSDAWLENTFSVWITTDPSIGIIPSGWYEKEDWTIALEPIGLENADLIICDVISIEKGVMDLVLNDAVAIAVQIRIPGTIEPGLYHLHVAFAIDLTEAIQDVDFGMYLGEKGTAGLSGGGFYLAEANCVYVPWVNDPLPEDTIDQNPYSIITISDVHIAFTDENRIVPSNIEHLDSLRMELELWGPEAIIITGDLTNSPKPFPEEYVYGCYYYRSLGIPVITSNGNHDQGNLGLFSYYFGSLQSRIDWGGLEVISFNSALQIDARTANWIIEGIKTGREANKPCILASHIPLMDVFNRDTSGSSATIIDAMVKYNGTAILHGHNHYDLVLDAEKARDAYLKMTGMEYACEIPTQGFSSAVNPTGPKILITTSAAKASRDRLQAYWPEFENYEGYRRITLAENRMINYTYDLNNDGVRDASYSQPLFHLNRSIVFDENIGTDISAGVTYTIMNNLTEPIPNAKLLFLVPNAPTGYNWAANGHSNLILRSTFSNGTHQLLEYRVPVAAKSNLVISLMPVLGS